MIIGASFSMHPNAYEQYKETKDGEIFEKLISDIILNKHSDDQNLTEFILSLPKEKQRLAVLSLIDKERKGDVNHLWSEMVSYVKDNVNKMDHIKDVIKIINKFVKDGEVEKKKHGEVMTPITLVREMLDSLPKEVWSNPDLKWLDPANGAGTFPFVVIYKLMNGLSEWEPDEEKRYKHIVESMIYTCELQSRNVFLWLCGVDPKDEYTTNTYWGSFLDEGFDKHMKDVWNIEKFDIVVGNPPYNDSNIGDNNKTKNLYNLFTEKAIRDSDKIIFITPSRWFGIENMKTFRENILKNGLKKVVICPDDVFGSNVSIDGGVSFFFIEKTHTGDVSIENKDGNIIGGILKGKILLSDKISTIDSILNKISKKSNLYLSEIYKRPQLIKSNDKRFSENGIDVLASKGRVLKIDTDYDDSKQHFSKYKVVFEKTSGSFRKSGISGLDIKYPNILTTESIAYIPFNSLEESKSCLSYLKTKFTFMLRDIIQYDKNFNQYIFNLIPIVPFNREWTDEQLFDYFYLTEEERNIVLNYDKK